MSARLLAASLALCTGACSSGGDVVDRHDPRLYVEQGVTLFDSTPLTGAIVTRDADGRRTALAAYREGRRHGRSLAWYGDGSVRDIRRYRNGLKEGLQRGWWANGRLRFEHRYRRGLQQGIGRTWYADGQLFEQHRYRDGHEEGLQRLWFDDGRLRASYEVRDGRRYGWIGAKSCASGVPGRASL